MNTLCCSRILQNQVCTRSEYHVDLADMTRDPVYKEGCKKIDVSMLNGYVKVDIDAKLIYVEPLVSMESLLAATLAHGLVPAVLPEFRNITVGGALSGAGLESTSHRHGQLSDIVEFMDILLGDGTVCIGFIAFGSFIYHSCYCLCFCILLMYVACSLLSYTELRSVPWYTWVVWVAWVSSIHSHSISGCKLSYSTALFAIS